MEAVATFDKLMSTTILFCHALSEMALSYKRMLMNVGLLFLCLSTAMEGANAAALGSFALKYYSIEFAVAPSLSSLFGSEFRFHAGR